MTAFAGEAELVRAMLAAPADDGPRWVFADAAQAAGDPRGEYIAHALAQRDSDFDVTLAGQAAWVNVLGRRVRQVKDWDRGFPHEVVLDCANRDAAALAVLERAPITRIELQPENDPEHRDLGPTDLETLYEQVAAWVAADPRTALLDRLCVNVERRSQLTGWGEPALRTLLGADLRGLHSLVVWSSDCVPYLADALARNPTITRLASLWLHGLSDARGVFARLAAWPGFASVTALTAMLVTLDDADLAALADGAHVGALAELRLETYQRGFGADGVAALARSTRLAALALLGVSGRPTDAALPVLGACAGLPALRTLEIADSDISDRGVEALAASPRLARLERLWLWSCRGIGPAGARALAAAPGAAGLRELDLAYTRIGPDGARALADSPHLRGLTALRANEDLQDVLEPAFGARYEPARSLRP